MPFSSGDYAYELPGWTVGQWMHIDNSNGNVNRYYPGNIVNNSWLSASKYTV
jgi:hypothetical protein